MTPSEVIGRAAAAAGLIDQGAAHRCRKRRRAVRIFRLKPEATDDGRRKPQSEALIVTDPVRSVGAVDTTVKPNTRISESNRGSAVWPPDCFFAGIRTQPPAFQGGALDDRLALARPRPLWPRGRRPGSRDPASGEMMCADFQNGPAVPDRDYSGISFRYTGGHAEDRSVHPSSAALESGYMGYGRQSSRRSAVAAAEKFQAARAWDDWQPSPPQRHERERHQTVAYADLTPFHTACATGAACTHGASRPIPCRFSKGIRDRPVKPAFSCFLPAWSPRQPRALLPLPWALPLSLPMLCPVT